MSIESEMKLGKPKKNFIDSNIKQIYGKKVKYLALGNPVLCKNCGVQKRSAMLSEYNGQYYCSELCVKQHNQLGE